MRIERQRHHFGRQPAAARCGAAEILGGSADDTGQIHALGALRQATGLRDINKQAVLFFVKKNQKTFAFWPFRLDQRERQRTKVFAAFFKKKR
jgi:hypothetical protein